jgi:hypothetical protein
MAVPLYRQVGKGKARRYQKVNLGRRRRPADLTFFFGGEHLGEEPFPLADFQFGTFSYLLRDLQLVDGMV